MKYGVRRYDRDAGVLEARGRGIRPGPLDHVGRPGRDHVGVVVELAHVRHLAVGDKRPDDVGVVLLRVGRILNRGTDRSPPRPARGSCRRSAPADRSRRGRRSRCRRRRARREPSPAPPRCRRRPRSGSRRSRCSRPPRRPAGSFPAAARRDRWCSGRRRPRPGALPRRVVGEHRLEHGVGDRRGRRGGQRDRRQHRQRPTPYSEVVCAPVAGGGQLLQKGEDVAARGIAGIEDRLHLGRGQEPDRRG